MRKVIVSLARLLSRIGIFEGLCQGIIAAHAVGEGEDAYRRKQYERALSVLKPVADLALDDPYVGSAQYMVGLLYLHGLGVDKNAEQARNYFQRAVDRGNADAEKYLK